MELDTNDTLWQAMEREYLEDDILTRCTNCIWDTLNSNESSECSNPKCDNQGIECWHNGYPYFEYDKSDDTLFCSNQACKCGFDKEYLTIDNHHWLCPVCDNENEVTDDD